MDWEEGGNNRGPEVEAGKGSVVFCDFGRVE